VQKTPELDDVLKMTRYLHIYKIGCSFVHPEQTLNAEQQGGNQYKKPPMRADHHATILHHSSLKTQMNACS
jgi:hypothetical protein